MFVWNRNHQFFGYLAQSSHDVYVKVKKSELLSATMSHIPAFLAQFPLSVAEHNHVINFQFDTQDKVT